jgi:hypothetical protein
VLQSFVIFVISGYCFVEVEMADHSGRAAWTVFAPSNIKIWVRIWLEAWMSVCDFYSVIVLFCV